MFCYFLFIDDDLLFSIVYMLVLFALFMW